MAQTGANPARGSTTSSAGNFEGLTRGGASPSPWSMVGGAADAIGGFFPLPTEYSGDKGALTLGLDAAYDTASDAMMQSGTPWGMIAGGAMKANKLLGKGVKALGGGTDGMTTTDAIMGSAFMQMTPLGLINGFGGSKTDKMHINTEALAQVGSSYGKSLDEIISANHFSGKKFGLFSKGAKDIANLKIHEALRKQSIISNIAEQENINKEVVANQLGIASDAYSLLMNGGYDQSAMRAARQGMKLFNKESIKRTLLILTKKKRGGTIEIIPFVFDYSDLFENPKSEETIQEFKEGGSMNVIPEGALHAHKHHMEELTPELDGQITKKGIPVVIEKDRGEVELQAEIELNEIIFTKEVTELIEEAYKEYYKEDTIFERKDELAINIGKLLSVEIIENTDDRTGLIQKI